MKSIEVVMNGMEFVHAGSYCRWLADVVRLEGKPPPPKSYAGTVLALMLAGI